MIFEMTKLDFINTRLLGFVITRQGRHAIIVYDYPAIYFNVNKLAT